MTEASSVHWTLMSSHGVILLCIAADTALTLAEVSKRTGLTPRRVGQVIRDLAEADLFTIERHGRRNAYRLNRDTRLREPSLPHSTLGEFLDLFASASSASRATALQTTPA